LTSTQCEISPPPNCSGIGVRKIGEPVGEFTTWLYSNGRQAWSAGGCAHYFKTRTTRLYVKRLSPQWR